MDFYAVANSIALLGEQIVYNFSRLRLRTRILMIPALILLSTLSLAGTSDMRNISVLHNAPNRTPGNDDARRWEWVRPRRGHLIPPKIWQIMLPKQGSDSTPINPDTLKETATWLAMNPDYIYTLVGRTGGEDFIQRHFGHDTHILSTYKSLPNVGMQSDLLRYLLLDIEGGIYTDTDTIALKPIDEWVPYDLRNQTRLVVGIEFDQRDDTPWQDILHPLQFCQWTIAAAPGHRIFQNMVTRIMSSVDDMIQKNEVSQQELSSLKPSSFEVMNSTGPAAWTEVVWEYIQATEPDGVLTDIRNLSRMAAPTLYGDVLVLPINGFGMGQRHSGSVNDGTTPDDALVKHLFGGTWRGD
ncbi:initiation-specific alpha-1,6-mannosyltransferase [Colletotrichum zoysiae]|uniref:Initiation-specific alpha-1,6-mannosyltransferase n=1 Tax=Colletotrichum zoysiae TaxID=1216348 RepID=A0AAD9HHG9_9PEZI|nr:initiation-specific alpha-1,6-mannosyltransferase [Colletotrichum zoysiae]